MLRTATLLVGLVMLALAPVQAQTVRVTDDITSNTTWTSANTYLLDGLIFVDPGATLEIEAGTVIKGVEADNITTGDGASALIVRRGARIEATGTASDPIIFTAEIDDVNDAFDTDERDRELWGGVIILGRAPTNANDGNGNRIDVQIEGIEFDPATQIGEEAQYGGDDPMDDSGIFRYVSIRHGGFSISGVEGDEINGLTLGAVGAGTTIEYVEVYANFDDCFEWFGGTVETKYLAGLFCGDDTFDYDQGYNGKGQFWLSLQSADVAGRGGEHDGGDNDLGGEGSNPFAIPTISNVTFIGAGVNATPSNDDANNPAVFFRDNAGGKYYNSVYTDFPAQALRIEDLASGADSRERLENGDLVIANSLFSDFGAGTTLESLIQEGSQRTPASVVAPILVAAGNAVVTSDVIVSASRTADEGFNPRPVNDAASGASFSADPLGDDFFHEVGYRGAFDPVNPVWLTGWSVLDTGDYLSPAAVTVSNGSTPTVAENALRALYPNPATSLVTLEFDLAVSGPVRIAAYDLLGREVAVLADGPMAEGEASLALDARQMPAGTYVLRVSGEGFEATRKLTVIR
ncbi:MAG: T9SS type A sorting domain-containing protein [Bacteroidota bacterium]